MRLLRLKEVTQRTGLSRSSIYKYIEKSQFPKQVQLSERTVAWSEVEIDAWIKSKIGESRDE